MVRERQAGDSAAGGGGGGGHGVAPGKRTLTERLGPVVQRKVSEGWKGEDSWNAGRTTVDGKGNAARAGAPVPNAQPGGEPAPGADAVNRVVLDGLTHAKSGRAIVVVPSADTLKKATSLDVLLHFHGGGDAQGEPSNNRERANTAKATGKAGSDSERTHDLHLGKVPQQLAAHAGAVVAITVERKGNDAGEVTDGLADEVFDHLRAQGLLQATHVRGRTIVAGHSAGAVGALAEAKEHEPGSGTGPGRGKPQETVHGLFLFDPVTGLIPGVMALAKRRLENDLAQLTALPAAADQLAYLKTDGYMVRIFGEAPVFNADANDLQSQLDAWFAAHKAKLPTDATVMARWRANYQAIAVPRAKGGNKDGWDTHRSIEGAPTAGPIWDRNYVPGSGNLERALNDWRTQHS
jgi:hypothetical protein